MNEFNFEIENRPLIKNNLSFKLDQKVLNESLISSGNLCKMFSELNCQEKSTGQISGAKLITKDTGSC